MGEFYETLQGWNACVCLHGQCGAIRDAIREQAEPLCDEIRVLPGGTMICRVAGEGDPLMVWADMGNAGFYVSGFDEKGFARAAEVGVNLIDYENTPLRTPDGIYAVLRAEEVYGDKTDNKTKFFLDFGENRDLPPLGTPLVYDVAPARLWGSKVRMPFAGSHVPCVALLALIRAARVWGREMYFVFADGAEGAAQAAYALKPACVLTLMAAEANDACAKPEDRNVLRIGSGAVLKLRDYKAPCLSRTLPHAAEKAALQAGTVLQHDFSQKGDAGYKTIQFQHCGIPMIALAVPVRYIDTPACICDLEDVKALIAVAAAFCSGKEED